MEGGNGTTGFTVDADIRNGITGIWGDGVVGAFSFYNTFRTGNGSAFTCLEGYLICVDIQFQRSDFKAVNLGGLVIGSCEDPLASPGSVIWMVN